MPAFATSRKFTIKKLKRLIDWTPGLEERDAIVYHDYPEWETAEPALDAKFLDTVERLLAMNSGEDQSGAMRWYRLAIQAPVPEEQFSYFWFALEIAAEAMKGKDKVPSKCPRCQGKLFCEVCKDHPLHRRYIPRRDAARRAYGIHVPSTGVCTLGVAVKFNGVLLLVTATVCAPGALIPIWKANESKAGFTDSTGCAVTTLTVCLKTGDKSTRDRHIFPNCSCFRNPGSV